MKQWLTLPDAARHLAIVFGEKVTEADVLRLALDRQLPLSVYFVNSAKGLRGQIVPIANAHYEEVPSPDDVTTVKLYKGPVLFTGGEESHVLELEDEVLTLEGVFNLPMIGNERLDVEYDYHLLTDGPKVTRGGMEGVLVEGKDGSVFQLQDHFDDNRFLPGSRAQQLDVRNRIARGNLDESAEELLNAYQEDRRKLLEKKAAQQECDSYFPAGTLPKDRVLVVRTEALREFEQSLNEAETGLNKPVAATERCTLLTVIAALCDYSDIKHQERGSPVAIARMTEEIGAAVTDETIRKLLSRIPEALERRRK